MENLRVELESKLESLRERRAKLLSQQQQQLNATSFSAPHSRRSTSSQLDLLVLNDIIDRTIAITDLLKVTDDHCSDQLQHVMSMWLDVAAGILLLSTSSDPSNTASSACTFRHLVVVALVWVVLVWMFPV